MGADDLFLPISKINKFNFPIGEEFDSFTSGLGCSKTGSGFLFDCAWFDALLSGIIFGVVLIASQLISERMTIYQKLDKNERYDWVASLANWLLSVVSGTGSLYILFTNDWYLDHPADANKNVLAYDKELNFFVPWMIGYNIGRIFHVISGLVRALYDVNKMDILPHLLHILLYGVIIENKKFGMIAVFQMLLQSHHLYTVPQTIMEYTKHSNNICYTIIDWFGFFTKSIVLIFSGPYCLSILWFHWDYMKSFSFITKITYIIVIGLNTGLFTADIAFGVYWVYCFFAGKDAKEWYKNFKDRQKREERLYRQQGYKHVTTNDIQTDSDEDLDLGIPTNIELTQRTTK